MRRRKFMFKKLLVLGIVLSILISSIGIATSAEKVTIKFSTWGSPEEVNINKELIAEFEKRNPDIHVELLYIPGGEYWQKIQTMVAGGTPPDVMFSGTMWSYDLFSRGAVIDLQPYFEKDSKFKNIKDYYIFKKPQLASLYKDGKAMFGLPGRTNVNLLYYNKTSFDEAGVAYPTDKWKWDDFLKAAQKLTKWDGNRMVQAGTTVSNWHAWLNLWIFQNGGFMFNKFAHPTKCTLNSPASVSALQFIQDLVYKYHVAPTPAQSQALPGGFMTGKIAMEVGGAWSVEQYRQIKEFKWDVAPPPGQKIKANHVRLGAYSILSQSKYKDEAWKFLSFLFSPEGHEIAYSKVAIWNPDLVSVGNNRNSYYYKLPGLPEHYYYRVTEMEIPNLFPGEVLHPNASKILDTELPTGLDSMFLGKESASEAVKKLVPKIDTLLKEK